MKHVLIDDELSFIPGILLIENYYVPEKIVKLTLSAWPKYLKDFKRTCLSTLVDIFLYLVVKDIIFGTSFKKFHFSIVTLVTFSKYKILKMQFTFSLTFIWPRIHHVSIHCQISWNYDKWSIHKHKICYFSWPWFRHLIYSW